MLCRSRAYLLRLPSFTTNSIDQLSTTTSLAKDDYKLLVLGGGTGGTALSNRFANKLGKGKVAVVEPSDTHYYQPMWTLVGGGMKKLSDSARPTEWCLNKNVDWIKDRVAEIQHHRNKVLLESGKELEYDYLVVALGIQLRYDMIKGLPEAFETPGVCSNYNKNYVGKTLKALEGFKSGNAIFTFPATPIKCPGAPQKICYISEDYFRLHGKRDQANVIYNTTLPVIFGVKKYADALWKVCEERGITVNLRHTLTEVKPEKKEAVFDVLDEDGKTIEKKVFPYEMLHVAPPCTAPDVLKKSPELIDGAGFLDVKKGILQHTKFRNIFGLGDCTNSPNARTAAAVAAQSGIVARNIEAVMNNKEPHIMYDGYTSCPLITGYSKCIMAEFDYNLEPLETFPFDQGKERRTMFHFKKDIIPNVYWHMLLQGWWDGPASIRKLCHLGMSK